MQALTDQPAQQATVIDSFPLSAVQAGMLVNALKQVPGEGTDVQQIAMTVLTPLDPGLFVYAWYQVMDRHAVLRTRFRWEGVASEPVQEVLDAVELPVQRVDWRGLSPEILRERLLAEARAHRSKGFDLSKAPLMRLFMARIGDTAWSVLWSFHHAILDGRSFPIVWREVFDIHDALRGRREPDLALPMPFRRYVELCAAADMHEAERYWRSLLAGFGGASPVGLELPAGLAASSPSHEPFGARQLILSDELSQALAKRAREASLTVATLLYAAWTLMLHRCSGSRDIAFGTTLSTRHRLGGETHSWVGPFIVTVPMRVAVDRQQTVDDWLADIRAQQLAMRPHALLPLTRIQACMDGGPEASLFETLVVYDRQSLSTALQALGPAWAHRHADYVGQTGYPMTLVAYGDNRMPLRLEYDRRRFSDMAAERLLDHLHTVLQGLAADAVERVGQLPWLTALQRDALLGRSARHFAPTLPLHRLFEQQARRAPLSPALTLVSVDGLRQEISYGRLNAQANRLARRLLAMGVGRGELIGLRVERHLDVVLGVLAILKCGAAYLPLDPVYPLERTTFMLKDADVRVAIVSESLSGSWSPQGIDCLALDRGHAMGDTDALLTWDEAEADLPDLAGPSDLAYVIYTSGSTGQPKGVRITHHNVERLFAAARADFDFDERDVWTLFHSYAFDFSVWEMWGALLNGGRLVVIPQDLSRDAEAFVELIIRERVTVLNQTPTAFRRLVDLTSETSAMVSSLRYVIFGGEALELQMLKPWFDRYGDVRPQLVNMYGITETTVHVTRRVIRRSDVDQGLGSVIGEPLADLQLLLLDAHGEPVPAGATGELVVGGDGLSPGYLNRPELTAERFVPDMFSGTPGRRLYRSGDLARWLDNGELEYLGRQDRQVKIRGFRIELGDIEAQMAQHPKVRQAAVIVREDAHGERRLFGYAVPRPGLALTDGLESLPRDLLAELRRVLPDYMVPAQIVTVAELPMTANGKLDAKALPLPSASVPVGQPAASPAVASTPTEAVLTEIWRGVLRREDIDLQEHFFALGGDSILSIQIVARCREKGLRLSLRDLFECPTVQSLAARLDQRADTPAPHLSADVRPQPANVPIQTLNPIQQWFYAQDFAEAHHWNQALMLEVDETVTTAQVQHGIERLMTLHPALVQCFRRQGDGRVAISPERPGGRAQSPRVVRVEQAGRSQAAFLDDMRERTLEAHAGLDPEEGLMLRAVHFVGDHGPSRLLLVIHHLVVDGVSWSILREDLEELILAHREGRAPRLMDEVSGMSDWIAALQRYVQRPDVLSSVARWCALSDVPPVVLPQPAASALSSREPACEHNLRLGTETTRRLLQVAVVQLGVSINAVLMSSLLRALAASTGRSEWRIDMEGHGREPVDDSIDLSRSVGWFTSLFPVHLALTAADPGSASVVDAVQAAHAVNRQLAEVHDRGLSFGALRWLGPASVRAQLAAVTAAPILFNYLGQGDAWVAGSRLFRFAEESSGPWRSPAAHRSHPLELVVMVRKGCLELMASYDGQVVDGPWVAELLGAWSRALEELVSESAVVGEASDPAPSAMLPLQEVRTAPTSSDAEPFALTPIQQLYFAMDQVKPALGLQQWQFVLEGPLNTVRLRRALVRVLERHDVLRCAFWQGAESQAWQQPRPLNDVPWVEEDWRDLSGSEPARKLAQRLLDDQHQAFDLSRPPLMRVRLIRLANATWHLIWTTHHLTLDGWSWPLVMGEWSRTYAALESGWALQDGQAMTYREFADWRLRHHNTDKPFWQGLLSGFTAPTPVVSPERLVQDSETLEVIFEMQEAQSARLTALARRWRVTPSTLAHAAWAVCLAHASTASQVLFGTTLAGRPPELPGVESLVGPCINNLPVPVRFDEAQTLPAFLQALQGLQMALAERQYTALEDIQDVSEVAWRYRLFDSLLVFQNNQMDPDVARMGTQVCSTLIAVPEATNVPLTLSITPTPGWRLRFMAAQGSGLLEDDLRTWIADLMASWAALDALGHVEDAGHAISVQDWLRRMPSATAGRTQPLTEIAGASQAAAGPASDVETQLLCIWRELLGVEHVPTTGNLFELGAHSLLLVRAHRIINERLRLQLPLITLLQFPSISALARHIEGQNGGDTSLLAGAALDRVRKRRASQQKYADRPLRHSDLP